MASHLASLDLAVRRGDDKSIREHRGRERSLEIAILTLLAESPEFDPESVGVLHEVSWTPIDRELSPDQIKVGVASRLLANRAMIRILATQSVGYLDTATPALKAHREGVFWMLAALARDELVAESPGPLPTSSLAQPATHTPRGKRRQIKKDERLGKVVGFLASDGGRALLVSGKLTYTRLAKGIGIPRSTLWGDRDVKDMIARVTATALRDRDQE